MKLDSPYQTILFDLDGTLTDPQEGIINSVQYALRKMNIDENNREGLVKFIGPPLTESFQTFYKMSPEDAWQAVEFYREYFKEKGMYENIVYPGIPELLQELKKADKMLFVATSKPTVFSEKILEYFELAQYFNEIVGSNLDGTRVAKSEVIQHIFAMYSLDKERTVMVGDREHDIIGAKNNDIDSIAVTYGYGSFDELNQALPNQIVNSVKELMLLLK